MTGGTAYVGCAGWSLNAEAQKNVSAGASHLERYAATFNCTEIDSSFYRHHQPKTYARWASSVPAGFRFAVKMPKAVTHDARLAGAPGEIGQFLAEVSVLGDRLGPVLVQLPPSLAYDAGIAAEFFADMRRRFDGDLVCEPRHASWFVPEAERLLVEHRVARVAADPASQPEAAEPGGWPGLVYVRLHGSPEVYRSKYAPAFLETVADRIRAAVAARIPAWTILDNTMLGHAFFDAVAIRDRVSAPA